MHGAVKKLHNLIEREVIQVRIPSPCGGVAFPCILNTQKVSEQARIKKEAKRGPRRQRG